jgi:hypothetical protein
MPEPRDINAVYAQIEAAIPDEYVELKRDLKTFIDSIWNLAPEVCRGPSVYLPFADILVEHIPTIRALDKAEPVWKYNVRDIFAGKALTRMSV